MSLEISQMKHRHIQNGKHCRTILKIYFGRIFRPMSEKYGSVTKHKCGSIPLEAHRQIMEKSLKRSVDNFELFERCHKSNKGSGDFVDRKSKIISEEYRARHGWSDASSPPPFDLPMWCEVTGGPTKGRLYGIGCSQNTRIRYEYTGDSNERLNEISKVLDDVQAKSTKLEEVYNRVLLELEESKKREDEARKREEEARIREDKLQELIRKMIKEVGGKL